MSMRQRSYLGASIRPRLDVEVAAGKRLMVVDALKDADLLQIRKASKGRPLITGGLGDAFGLPASLKISVRTTSTLRGETGKMRCFVGVMLRGYSQSNRAS
jgi:uncharacterized protein YgbK (DUF1537 family)